MKSGGFDVIIGNPPYVEYRLVHSTYTIPRNQFKSEAVNNLYAFCMERSGTLTNASGRFGMIVPAGLLGLDEAVDLREILLERFRSSWCSTYAIRPSKLFDGVDQRLCIFVGGSGSNVASRISSTRYHHWNVGERPGLFSLLRYQPSFNYLTLNRIPQIGSAEAASVLTKLNSNHIQTISSYYAPGQSGFLLHYHRSPRCWIRGMDFEQYFKSQTRTRSVHHFRDLYFKSEAEAKVVGAILNSSLFFFWFISVGNGRNLTGTDVEQFPVGPISDLSRKKIATTFDQLMGDYRHNSFVRVRRDCEYQEFRPNMSKPLIDKIDEALGRHYGFTDDELDFIVNYDIKYRMGLEGQDGEDK